MPLHFTALPNAKHNVRPKTPQRKDLSDECVDVNYDLANGVL
jgi:hypothetical protein